MKATITALTLSLLLPIMSWSQDLIQLESEYRAAQTMKRLKAAVEKRGLQIFSEYNHQEQARQHDLELPPLRVLVFGNPQMGTRLMQADLKVGLELPLKMMVYQTEEGCFLAYRDPLQLLIEFDLAGVAEVIEKMMMTLNAIAAEATGTDEK